MKIIKELTNYPLRRELPANYQNGDSKLFDVGEHFLIPPLKLLYFERVRIFEDGSLFENGKLIKETIRDPGMLKIYSCFEMTKRNFLYKKISLGDGPWITVLDHWLAEYYHWFMEAVPRLIFLLENNSGAKLILSERCRGVSYIEETIKRLKVKEVNFLPRKSYADVETLMTSTYMGPSDFHREEYLRRVRALFNNDVHQDRKVYISRGKARYRKVVNEADVIDLLKEFGFEIIYAEELDFKKQVELFSRTSHLITNHGAGLSNIVFMGKGARVMEFRKSSYGFYGDSKKRETSKFYNTYYHMCLALGLDYYYMSCDSPEPEQSCHYADITVNVETLKDELKNFME